MSRLALFLLGPPRIERDGVLVNVDTRKAIALFAYLAITQQNHSRDTLATLLWPEYDQPHARATLRRTLSALNKALAGNWLEIGRETVGLNQNSDFWLDVEHFSNLLAQCQTHGHSSSEICSACLQPLAEAVALYRDDFLAGFSLRDSPNLIAGNSINLIAFAVILPMHLNALSNVTAHKAITNLRLDMLDVG